MNSKSVFGVVALVCVVSLLCAPRKAVYYDRSQEPHNCGASRITHPEGQPRGL